MTTILGLSGSLRSGSYNTALLRAAAGLMPAGATLDIATLHGIEGRRAPARRPFSWA